MHYHERWYLRYPRSSFLALTLAALVTVGLWIPLAVLPDAFACLVCIILVATLFFIIWLFRTGTLTSIMIAFVAWYHLGMIALALFCYATGTAYVYDFPRGSLDVCGISFIAAIIATVHGVIAGLRQGRSF
ncbi:MAG TPA: hypothetical protein DD670_08050 [Planctomycetaceae bacterium]|nr:hypothetical protein [Planctomycetaceae bacterium]